MEVNTNAQVSESLTKFGDAARSAAARMDELAAGVPPGLLASIKVGKQEFVGLSAVVAAPSAAEMREKMIEARRAHREKRITGSIGRKGTRNRRIIHVEVKDGREHRFHVTKGWRIVRES